LSSSAYGFGSDVRATLGRDDRATIARLAVVDAVFGVFAGVARAIEDALERRTGSRIRRAFVAFARVVVVFVDTARAETAREHAIVVVIACIVARVVDRRASRVEE
jgi:ABC-type antimicrobial peptide transport system permease subunit